MGRRLLMAAMFVTWGTGHAIEPRCVIESSTKFVHGQSMSGLFSAEERISIQEGWYGCHEVQRDDIVLVKIAGRARPLLKMVRVLPRDRFMLKASKREGVTLQVNGKVLRTPSGTQYIFRGNRAKMLRLYEKQFSGVMPAETFFIFGTVSGGSFDSTRFGAVSRTQLIARVLKVKN